MGNEQSSENSEPARVEVAAPAGRSRWRETVFALAALSGFLILGEGVLRLVGFHFVPVPILVDSAWGPETIKAINQPFRQEIFCRDNLLFWRFIPGVKIVYGQINQLGLLNPPIAIPKPTDTCRLLCLGDSCTAHGPVSYVTYLRERLGNLNRPDRRYDVVNAGCFGYSSLQGLRLFRDRLDALEPDLVTVYFGWNDHYLARVCPDRMVRSRVEPAPGLIRLLRHVRLYQFMQRVIHAHRKARLERQQRNRQLVRVSEEDYRANLSAIVRLARERNAQAILFTAPSNHGPGRVSRSFLRGLGQSEEELIRRHRAYNRIVREVAKVNNVELLDLEAVFDQREKDALFLTDGVHPNETGHRLIGKLLMEKLLELGIGAETQHRQLSDTR